MKSKILDPKKDPLGCMMIDYLAGDTSACVHVESPDLDMWEMKGSTMFRSFGRMNHIEKKALKLCRGCILDVGAGSGCHSLYLQKRHDHVAAMDISPGCVEVMKKEKIRQPMHENLFALQSENGQYDTILMLMNGLGICGSIDGLHLFFQFIKDFLSENGQILADSTDIASLYDVDRLAPDTDAYYGETQFTMSYKEIKGDPFDWLYIDFDTLQYIAGLHGFSCKKIWMQKDFKYLARLSVTA